MHDRVCVIEYVYSTIRLRVCVYVFDYMYSKVKEKAKTYFIKSYAK